MNYKHDKIKEKRINFSQAVNTQDSTYRILNYRSWTLVIDFKSSGFWLKIQEFFHFVCVCFVFQNQTKKKKKKKYIIYIDINPSKRQVEKVVFGLHAGQARDRPLANRS